MNIMYIYTSENHVYLNVIWIVCIF